MEAAEAEAAAAAAAADAAALVGSISENFSNLTGVSWRGKRDAVSIGNWVGSSWVLDDNDDGRTPLELIHLSSDCVVILSVDGRVSFHSIKPKSKP